MMTTHTCFYVIFIYGKTMMVNFLGFDTQTAGKYALFTVISYALSTVIFGYLSDKINRINILLLAVSGLFVSALPFINSLKNGTPTSVLLMCLCMGALIGMIDGTLNSLTAETFPTNIRATSVSFCWNFTSIAFGGIAPIISMWLIENFGDVNAVAYYLMSICAVSIIGLCIMLYKSKAQLYKHIDSNPSIKLT